MLYKHNGDIRHVSDRSRVKNIDHLKTFKFDKSVITDKRALEIRTELATDMLTMPAVEWDALRKSVDDDEFWAWILIEYARIKSTQSK